MPDIVISEFMDQEAVDSAARKFDDILYEADLVDRPDDLKAQLAGARGLVVRNRTQVTKETAGRGPQTEGGGPSGRGPGQHRP